MTPEPIVFELDKERGVLRVGWEDAHESAYPLGYLRGYCPCAVCQGHGGQWEFVPTEDPRLGAIEEVGQYALNLIWVDGHRTGIYSFELLRTLCPCEACREQQGEKHPMARM